jgi:hypothetical protein
LAINHQEKGYSLATKRVRQGAALLQLEEERDRMKD